jgi:hypothetical protein
MRGLFIGFGLLAALAALPARADDASDRKNIVGTWKLVSVVYEGQETRQRTPIYGDLLNIESPPMPHPNLAGKVVRVIVTWRRDT